MKAALPRRVLRIERHCSGPRRTRFIWQDAGEEDVVEARKREMIASSLHVRPIGSSRRAGTRRTRAGRDADNAPKQRFSRGRELNAPLAS